MLLLKIIANPVKEPIRVGAYYLGILDCLYINKYFYGFFKIISMTVVIVNIKGKHLDCFVKIVFLCASAHLYLCFLY